MEQNFKWITLKRTCFIFSSTYLDWMLSYYTYNVETIWILNSINIKEAILQGPLDVFTSYLDTRNFLWPSLIPKGMMSYLYSYIHPSVHPTGLLKTQSKSYGKQSKMNTFGRWLSRGCICFPFVLNHLLFPFDYSQVHQNLLGCGSNLWHQVPANHIHMFWSCLALHYFWGDIFKSLSHFLYGITETNSMTALFGTSTDLQFRLQPQTLFFLQLYLNAKVSILLGWKYSNPPSFIL